eukprot:CAMPEP_0197301994 /NCGR_PEP_ID=MMETSP0890-20130614/50766_1 /TAXON_ID=44058 ORGANISM="Aureoumbra lagunensis, Strain CCMP1510" /NCGR_SAMPLE_ID=MMETSP0890 /ASSEMBLY_ACC=CAM_ASM_000533 /LENGTH=662 /DNA_ID=CAMNT_0042781471 /DNA_START=32 /DNA_END=2017 /DNA_ORIENTATION=-
MQIGDIRIELEENWDVGIGGSTWSCGQRVCEHMSTRLNEYKSSMRVLDLGAGTGVAGLYVAKAFPAAHVILTDLPDHIDLIQTNVDANKLRNVQVIPLDWTESNQNPLLLGEEFDLILATDCAYARKLHAPLLATIALACRTYDKTRCFLGVTKSDTGPEFLNEISKLGLEFSMLENDEYFALICLRQRAPFFHRSVGQQCTIIPCLAFVQDRYNSDTLFCSYCGKQPVATQNFLTEPQAQLEQAVSVCSCGLPYCCEICKAADAKKHHFLCVGPLDETHPLVTFRRAIYQTSDPIAWDLAAQYLAHCSYISEDVSFISENKNLEDDEQDQFPQWNHLTSLHEISTIKSQQQWENVFSSVRHRIIDIEIPHPVLTRLRSAYLQDTPLTTNEIQLLIQRYSEQVHEICGFTQAQSKTRILRRVLAAPEEFLETTGLTVLLSQEPLPHSCAPSAYYVLDRDPSTGAPALRLELYDKRCTELTVWRLRSCASNEDLESRNEAFSFEGFGDICNCPRCCFERDAESITSCTELELISAAARRDDRYDDLDHVLTHLSSISQSAHILFELYRVAGWRADFSLAQNRLKAALMIPGALDFADIRKAEFTRSAFVTYDLNAGISSQISHQCIMTTTEKKCVAVAPDLLDRDECCVMTNIALSYAETHGW